MNKSIVISSISSVFAIPLRTPVKPRQIIPYATIRTLYQMRLPFRHHMWRGNFLKCALITTIAICVNMGYPTNYSLRILINTPLSTRISSPYGKSGRKPLFYECVKLIKLYRIKLAIRYRIKFMLEILVNLAYPTQNCRSINAKQLCDFPCPHIIQVKINSKKFDG